ncbi:MAG: hypothetical protein DDT34_00422 [Firmicutes bacterium]|nr:hypothetical protein [Bacillota bacterium]MBT9153015.1 hypothetical protein [Bacillota bacterium]MBT9157549.1 hypothetical protein [Bacillota bacterium]
MARGLNKQDIFLDKDDRFRYLKTLAAVKEKTGIKVYAYCLMSNHVHLLLSEGQETVGDVMKRMGSSYVLWYNHKYERLGYLFQDRFRSEPVETREDLVAVVRYIHQNPVEAGLAADSSHYVWSSFLAYASGKEHEPGLTDTTHVLDAFGSLDQFITSHRKPCERPFVEANYQSRATPRQILAVANRILRDRPLESLKTMGAEDRNRFLRELKAVPGTSYAQIASLVGLSKKMVERA